MKRVKRRKRSERTRIAVHEAGHAVTARRLGVEVRSVRVWARRGEVLHRGPEPWEGIEGYRHDAIITLAGPLAECRFLGRDDIINSGIIDDPNTTDMIEIKEIVRWIVSYKTINWKAGWQLQDEVESTPSDDDWMAEWELQDEAARLVDQNWDAICRVAKALERKSYLNCKDLDQLIS
jgi:hypothetical protein